MHIQQGIPGVKMTGTQVHFRRYKTPRGRVDWEDGKRDQHSRDKMEQQALVLLHTCI